MAASLPVVLASLTIGCSLKAPAWRALQVTPVELAEVPGKLHGAPPCLRGLRKVEWGHKARWRLGTFTSSERNITCDIGLDGNPDEPCCKLFFYDAREPQRRVGYMLVASEAEASALRGMHICKELRGRGLSRLLLAIWLRACAEASLTPKTREINKPLLALSLARFGFTPVNGKGQVVRVHSGTQHLRNSRGISRGDVPPEAGEQVRTAYVRTHFEVSDAAVLDRAVATTLGEGCFALEVDSTGLRRALTLRGGAVSVRQAACARPCARFGSHSGRGYHRDLQMQLREA